MYRQAVFLCTFEAIFTAIMCEPQVVSVLFDMSAVSDSNGNRTPYKQRDNYYRLYCIQKISSDVQQDSLSQASIVILCRLCTVIKFIIVARIMTVRCNNVCACT